MFPMNQSWVFRERKAWSLLSEQVMFAPWFMGCVLHAAEASSRHHRVRCSSLEKPGFSLSSQ